MSVYNIHVERDHNNRTVNNVQAGTVVSSLNLTWILYITTKFCNYLWVANLVSVVIVRRNLQNTRYNLNDKPDRHVNVTAHSLSYSQKSVQSIFRTTVFVRGCENLTHILQTRVLLNRDSKLELTVVKCQKLRGLVIYNQLYSPQYGRNIER